MITQGRFDTINGVDHFTPDKTKALGSSGIVREEVFYLAKKNGRKFDVTEGKDGITVSDNKVYIPKIQMVLTPFQKRWCHTVRLLLPCRR